MTNLTIDVQLQSLLWKNQVCYKKNFLKKILMTTLDVIQISKKLSLEVSFLLTNNDTIQHLNKVYRHQDKPTNVLAFPLYSLDELKSELPVPAPHKALGDIVLAYETILQEAHEQKKSFIDHFTHLVIHGWLHLWGYDHQNDLEASVMEQLEIKILSEFTIPNPYKTMI